MWKFTRSNKKRSMPWPFGQSTVEFAFAMIVLMYLLYGLVQAARWVIMDPAERSYRHDKALLAVSDPEGQLNPKAIYYYRPDLEYRSK